MFSFFSIMKIKQKVHKNSNTTKALTDMSDALRIYDSAKKIHFQKPQPFLSKNFKRNNVTFLGTETT